MLIKMLSFGLISTIKVALVLTIGLFGFTQADLPADIVKCRPADVVCIANTSTYIIHKYPKGNEEFGLQALDEVELKNVVVSEKKGDSPVQLNLRLNTLKVNGFENAIIERVVGFEKDTQKSKFEVYGVLPTMLIKADYEMGGRILVLPVTGKGDATVKFKNFKFGFKVKVREEKGDDGKVYIKIDQIKSTTEPESMNVHFDNLFDGNKELGNAMNQVINENWRDVWTELQEGINNAVSSITKNLLVNVLQHLSYDDFYLKD